MEEEKILQVIRTKAKEYDESKIYYSLRQMRIRYVTTKQIVAIQTFLALYDLGQRTVTTNLFAALTNMEPGNALTLLHRLGDKRIINLIRELSSTTQPYRFSLSETFLKHFRPANEQPQQNI